MKKLPVVVVTQRKVKLSETSWARELRIDYPGRVVFLNGDDAGGFMFVEREDNFTFTHTIQVDLPI